MANATRIEFPAFVDGQLLTAVVHDHVAARERSYFEISFSNGFKEFFTLENGKVSGTRAESAGYISAIQHDLLIIDNLNTSFFFTIFQYEVGGRLVNVWVEQTVFEVLTVYTVSFEGRVRFVLNKINQRWQAGGSGLAEFPEQKGLVKKIGEMLDAL